MRGQELQGELNPVGDFLTVDTCLTFVAKKRLGEGMGMMKIDPKHKQGTFLIDRHLGAHIRALSEMSSFSANSQWISVFVTAIKS